MYQPFMGMIQYYAFDFAPRGWAICNGSTLSIAQNTALFSLLGTAYGGNGSSTFCIPDYRGRSISGFGGTHSMGEIAGTETVSILTNQMPLHTHTVSTMKITADNNTGTLSDPANNYPAIPDSRGANMYGNTAAQGSNLGAPTASIGTAGSGVGFNILSPYLPLTCCISLQGIYPSRN